jgi:hypothetical protein
VTWPSAALLRALRIVERHGPVRPADFAVLMWPDSPAHARLVRLARHRTPTRGAGLHLAAAGHLAKLQRRGYVFRRQYEAGYRLAGAGRTVLACVLPLDGG